MSVRKRTWTGPDGAQRESWVVDYSDGAGKRRLKTFQRKKEADAFAARSKVDVMAGTHVADSASVTVAEAASLWIESCRGRGLERSTVDAYDRHVRFHIAPFIGGMKLSQISAPVVRQFEDRFRNGDAKTEPRSPAMVRKAMTSLSSLIADARERGLCAVNAAREIRARRKAGTDRRADKRQKGRLKVGVDIPTPDEIRAVLAHLDGRWRPILLTAIFTGLRSSELRGLRWQDVDLKRRELHCRQRVDQYGAFGPPKSAAGERVVPLPPEVVKTLREWKLACPKGDAGLVFPTGVGTPESHANLINRGLIPVQIAAGVTSGGKAKYTGAHCLRHFYASWLINRRADGGLELPPKVVQVRMGHSSIVQTLDVYGHLFPSGDDGSEMAAAERLLLE